eukprot:16448146-Heterocapsa_arctica.AAC.1
MKRLPACRMLMLVFSHSLTPCAHVCPHAPVSSACLCVPLGRCGAHTLGQSAMCFSSLSNRCAECALDLCLA